MVVSGCAVVGCNADFVKQALTLHKAERGGVFVSAVLFLGEGIAVVNGGEHSFSRSDKVFGIGKPCVFLRGGQHIECQGAVVVLLFGKLTIGDTVPFSELAYDCAVFGCYEEVVFVLHFYQSFQIKSL